MVANKTNRHGNIMFKLSLVTQFVNMWSEKKPAIRKGYEERVGAAGLTLPLTQWLQINMKQL